MSIEAPLGRVESLLPDERTGESAFIAWLRRQTPAAVIEEVLWAFRSVDAPTQELGL